MFAIVATNYSIAIENKKQSSISAREIKDDTGGAISFKNSSSSYKKIDFDKPIKTTAYLCESESKANCKDYDVEITVLKQ